MDKLFGGFLVVVVVLAYLVPLTILRGYAAQQCWEWFIVPIFGLPALKLVQALGVGLTVTVFSPTPSFSTNKEEKWYKPLFIQALYPLLVLLFGAIYQCFM